MSDIKRPDSFTGCDSGDSIWAGTSADGKREVFRQDSSGQMTDITDATDAVEPIEGGFRIGGKHKLRAGYTAQRWSAECDSDAESNDTYRRGRVR